MTSAYRRPAFSAQEWKSLERLFQRPEDNFLSIPKKRTFVTDLADITLAYGWGKCALIAATAVLPYFNLGQVPDVGNLDPIVVTRPQSLSDKEIYDLANDPAYNPPLEQEFWKGKY